MIGVIAVARRILAVVLAMIPWAVPLIPLDVPLSISVGSCGR